MKNKLFLKHLAKNIGLTGRLGMIMLITIFIFRKREALREKLLVNNFNYFFFFTTKKGSAFPGSYG